MSEVVSIKQQQALPAFPKSTEKNEFVVWLYKARAAFRALDLSIYVDKPIAGMPVLERDRKRMHDATFEPVYDHAVILIARDKQKETYAKHVKRAYQAYNLIAQSLNEKQISMTQDVFEGNAYMLMHRLKQNYELSRSTASVQVLLARLDEMKRIPLGKEHLHDYFARLESVMHEVALMSPEMMLDSMKKLHFKQGLANDPVWKDTILVASQLDVGDKWTADQFKQHLIDQAELRKALPSADAKPPSTTVAKTTHVVTETDTHSEKALATSSSDRGRGRDRGGSYRGHRSRGGRGNRGRFGNDRNNNFNHNHTAPHNNRYHHERSDHSRTHHSNRPPTCFNCGEANHLAKHCRARKPNHENEHSNHNRFHTYTLNNNRNECNEQNKRTKHVHSYVVISYSLSSTTVHSADVDPTTVYDMILDSAATEHYVCNVNMMFNMITMSHPIHVKTANGWSVCRQRGSVRIAIDDTNEALLTDVCFMPDFTVNLLSVHRLTSHGATVQFNQDNAVVSRGDDAPIIIPKANNLYILSYMPYHNHATDYVSYHVADTHNNARSSTIDQLHNVHLQLAHVNYARIISMIKHNSITFDHNINPHHLNNVNDLLKRLRSIQCVGCLRGKMTRRPMTGSVNYHAELPLDVFAADVIIPNKDTRTEWDKYPLIIIDAGTNYTFVFMLRSKGEATDKAIALIKREQVAHGLTLKRLHSGNDSELKNARMREFLESQGTEQTCSTPHTPEHTYIERHIRTLSDKVRCVMHHCNAYVPLYGYAYMYAAYVQNRTTTSRDDRVTPREHYKGWKPTMKYMHVWGSDAHYHRVKAQRADKFAARSKKGVFVGYDDSNDSYLLVYNVDARSIVVSRDVQVFDNQFTEMQRAVQTGQHAHSDIDDVISSRSVSDDTVSDDDDDEGGDDALPDDALNNPEVMQSMFPVGTHIQPTSHMNIESSSSSSSSSLSSPSYTRKSSRLQRNTNQHYYGLNANAQHDNDSFEPSTYKQAITCRHANEWIAAIKDELSSLIRNNTWTRVRSTDDMNVVGTRWIFKIKRNPDGSIQRYKARLVAKGYTQQYGIDYNETFAPTLKYKSFRTLVVLSIHMHHTLHQLDVKTAFLHASVHENIYMSKPDGLDVHDDDEHAYVYKLNQALYGLKQAPHEWNKTIHRYLCSLGWTSCVKDPCLYVKRTRTNMMILGLFVDDMTASVHPDDVMQWEYDKYMLQTKYEITDIGVVKHVLGMTITHHTDDNNQSYTSISQRSYINDKLTEFNFTQSRPSTTPEEVQSHKHTHDTTTALDAHEHTLYRNIVGSLMYASLTTRPDITHAVNVLSRSNSNPTRASLVKAKRVLRYLAGTPTLGLTYTHSHTQMHDAVTVTAYSDADWGGDLDDRKSTTGYVMFINDNPVSWNSKKQQTVALSSAESEYMAISECMKEMLWLRALLSELGVRTVTPSIVHVDNQAAIQISNTDTHHDRTKHIDIRHHFIRDCINTGDVRLQWIETKMQRADIFTKALGSNSFVRLRQMIMKQ